MSLRHVAGKRKKKTTVHFKALGLRLLMVALAGPVATLGERGGVKCTDFSV